MLEKLSKLKYMGLYDKINKMSDEPGTYDEKLYRLLIDEKYSGGGYCRRDLGEGMEVVDQVIRGWWKPRFLLNHNKKTAYEWMYANQQLAIVDHKHIDWESMKRLPEEAWPQLRAYSFSYPSFINGYHNGIAEVQWQLIPDGRYWMDDDGYGMTSDIELNIYGFIDQEANIISKFHYYTNAELKAHILDKIRKDAEKELNNIKKTR